MRSNFTFPKTVVCRSGDSRKVLQMSDGIHEMGTVVWQLALCLLLSWLIVFVVLIKGIASLGKVRGSYLFATNALP